MLYTFAMVVRSNKAWQIKLTIYFILVVVLSSKVCDIIARWGDVEVAVARDLLE